MTERETRGINRTGRSRIILKQIECSSQETKVCKIKIQDQVQAHKAGFIGGSGDMYFFALSGVSESETQRSPTGSNDKKTTKRKKNNVKHETERECDSLT